MATQTPPATPVGPETSTVTTAAAEPESPGASAITAAGPPDPAPSPRTAGGRGAPATSAGAGRTTSAARTASSARTAVRSTRPPASPAGASAAAARPARTRQAATPKRPVTTLAIDIGGTGLKASVLDATGQMEHDRVRIPTPYPLSPQKLVTVLEDLIKPLVPFDRVSAGFPGMVRGGLVLSAPHFVSPDGPGGTPVPKLVKAWDHFDLESELGRVTGKPTKVANDADIQGAAVVSGQGFEAVLTLGTGVGTAFFLEGRLLPHFEFSHTPFRKGTYNEELGEAARRSIGNKKWQKRVVDAIETVRSLTFFEHCYIGGGNSSRVTVELPSDVTLVDNEAGLLGGIKLWERTT
jgi:polyphosphate glucokinase